MKKLIPFIVAALILVLASPAFAANVKVTGSINSQTGYNNQDDATQSGLFSNSELGLGVEAQLSENLKAVVGLKTGLWDLLHTDLLDSLKSGSGLDWNDFSVLVDKAYIESNGPLFAGMPSMITRLGTQEIAYSDFNGSVKAQGLGFSGLGIGPVSLAAFQGINKTEQVRGAQIGVHAIKGVDVTADVIHSGADATQQLSGALESTVKPIDPLTINAGVGYLYAPGSSDVMNTMAIRGKAEYQVIPALALHAGARRVGAGYTPTYRAEDENGDIIVAEDVFGVNGGLTAKALGATLNTDIDRAQKLSDATAPVVYTGTADLSRPVTVAGMNFVPKYSVTLKADEATMFSAMPTVDSQDLSVSYTAPNNVSITGGVNLTDIKAPKPYVNASMDLAF